MLSGRLIEAPVAQNLERDGLVVMLRADPREPHMGPEIAGIMRNGDHFPHCLRAARRAEPLPDRDAVIIVRTRPAPPHAHRHHPSGFPQAMGTPTGHETAKRARAILKKTPQKVLVAPAADFVRTCRDMPRRRRASSAR